MNVLLKEICYWKVRKDLSMEKVLKMAFCWNVIQQNIYSETYYTWESNGTQPRVLWKTF